MIEPPIVYAVRANDLDLVQKRIVAGLDLQHIDEKGDNALNAACTLGFIDIIKLLLKSGANPEWLDADGRNAFQCAEEQGKALAVLQGRDEQLVSDDDDDLEYSSVKLLDESELMYSKSRITRILSTYDNVHLDKNTFITMVNLACDSEDKQVRNRAALVNLINYISINEQQIKAATLQWLDDNNINRSLLAQKQTWDIYIGHDDTFSITMQENIDKKHDLMIALGYDILIKSIWLE